MGRWGTRSGTSVAVGPWGTRSGTQWDDGDSFDGVTKITIRSSSCIDAITVTYIKDYKPATGGEHGGDGGDKKEVDTI